MLCAISATETPRPRNELTTNKWDEHRFINVVRKMFLERFFDFALSMTDLARKVVIARNEAILMRTLVAIVVRLHFLFLASR